LLDSLLASNLGFLEGDSESSEESSFLFCLAFLEPITPDLSRPRAERYKTVILAISVPHVQVSLEVGKLVPVGPT
jgi:hypothetical protein